MYGPSEERFTVCAESLALCQKSKFRKSLDQIEAERLPTISEMKQSQFNQRKSFLDDEIVLDVTPSSTN